MKIRTIKNLSNRVYAVDVYADDFSELETERMVNYGEPEINIGGTIPPTNLIYTDDLRRLKSDSPFSRKVDGRDFLTDAEAETAADEWGAELVVRIKAGVDYLRGLPDTFTDEALEQY